MAAPTGIVKFKEGLIEAVAKACDIAVAEVQKTTTIEAFNSLIFLTPVDTGYARNSWALGIGSPSDFVPPELPKETVKAFHDAKKKNKVAPQPLLPAPSFPMEQLSLVDGKRPVYITSNIVYMQALEDGHSTQRPEGMVRVTLSHLEIDLEQRLK